MTPDPQAAATDLERQLEWMKSEFRIAQRRRDNARPPTSAPTSHALPEDDAASARAPEPPVSISVKVP